MHVQIETVMATLSNTLGRDLSWTCLLGLIHNTAFSVCVCGRQLCFHRVIENFLSLH